MCELKPVTMVVPTWGELGSLSPLICPDTETAVTMNSYSVPGSSPVTLKSLTFPLSMVKITLRGCTKIRKNETGGVPKPDPCICQQIRMKVGPMKAGSAVTWNGAEGGTTGKIEWRLKVIAHKHRQTVAPPPSPDRQETQAEEEVSHDRETMSQDNLPTTTSSIIRSN